MATVICIADNRACEDILAKSQKKLSVFGEGELCRLKEIKNPRRRAESATGLICLANVLEQTQGSVKKENTCFSVVRSEDGRPSFSDDALPDFSITHDGALSAAALTSYGVRVGIDIERADGRDAQLSEKQKRLAERFFDEDERARLLEGGFGADVFYCIWTEKEAYAKMRGGGLARLLAERDGGEVHTEVVCLTRYEIIYEQERYILTLCTDKSEPTELVLPVGCEVNIIKEETRKWK